MPTPRAGLRKIARVKHQADQAQELPAGGGVVTSGMVRRACPPAIRWQIPVMGTMPQVVTDHKDGPSPSPRDSESKAGRLAPEARGSREASETSVT